ncbi:hypothetical protein HGRIS_007317 [Hohenbuehelia grisea]|uniref:Uncharacterized protein n=1 Tax=Hohenbuehelia grisea TaxID=104357 RepID=A0ABR3J4E1_9AGAR
MTADPTTQSNYLEIASKHVAFDWNVDFEKQIIAGTATHSLHAIKDGVKEVIFDTSDLEIESVSVNGERTDVSPELISDSVLRLTSLVVQAWD